MDCRHVSRVGYQCAVWVIQMVVAPTDAQQVFIRHQDTIYYISKKRGSSGGLEERRLYKSTLIAVILPAR